LGKYKGEGTSRSGARKERARKRKPCGKRIYSDNQRYAGICFRRGSALRETRRSGVNGGLKKKEGVPTLRNKTTATRKGEKRPQEICIIRGGGIPFKRD